MPKTILFTAWVKNVHSLCVEGVVTRAQSYTGMYKTFTQSFTVWVKAPSFAQVIDTFPPSLYTPIFHQLPDKNSQLSTLSTAPIIKKKR
jgi:hypothetical protein